MAFVFAAPPKSYIWTEVRVWFLYRLSVPCYFWTTNMAVFEGKKSLNDIIINDTMSDDEVVASDVPPRYLFPSSLVQSARSGS